MRNEWWAVAICVAAVTGQAEEPEPIAIWPNLAPGETQRSVGRTLPRRDGENPPATRITAISSPRLVIHPAPQPGPRPAVVIFPGGAYRYVVADKEGSEAAKWLNRLGVTGCVLHYRTRIDRKPSDERPLIPWDAQAPLQDGQRAIRWLRAHADQWDVDPDAVGVLGFSAGGQAAALVSARHGSPAYAAIDAVDEQSCRPDFSMLIYPWRLTLDDQQLQPAFTVDKQTPPTFLVHADLDSASSLSSVLYYAALRRAGVSGELHVYQGGGHGYGMRPTPQSDVDTWPQRAAQWLQRRKIVR